MIEIKAVAEKDGYTKITATIEGNSTDVGVELSATIAEVLCKLEPAEGVSVKVLAYAIVDNALAALNNRKEVEGNGGN